MELTEKQKRFCEEYVIDMNGTQAAIRAGYSKKSARQTADQNMSKPDIKEYISKLRAEIAEANKLKVEDILEELRSLAFWNIQDFVGSGNEVLDVSTLDRPRARPVIGVKRTVRTFGEVQEVTTELKLADKRAALIDLGKHLGMFKDDDNDKKVKIVIKRK